MMKREYRETIDYTWTLSRAIDRAAEARAKLHGRVTRGEFELRLAEFRSSLRSLYHILPGEVRSRVGRPPSSGVDDMGLWLSRVIDELDSKGLLIKSRPIDEGGDI